MMREKLPVGENSSGEVGSDRAMTSNVLRFRSRETVTDLIGMVRNPSNSIGERFFKMQVKRGTK